MSRFLRARSREEGGFTLVELMVVVLVIGVLLAIAIPTFMGARKRSQNSAAQSSLRTGLVAAQVVYTDNESFSDAKAATLKKEEGSVDFVNSPTRSNEAGKVSVHARTTWGGAARSDSGECFYILAKEDGSVIYGSNSRAACNGQNASRYARSSEW